MKKRARPANARLFPFGFDTERFATALVDSITDQALAVRFSSKP
jgi:hypothetical protein